MVTARPYLRPASVAATSSARQPDPGAGDPMHQMGANTVRLRTLLDADEREVVGSCAGGSGGFPRRATGAPVTRTGWWTRWYSRAPRSCAALRECAQPPAVASRRAASHPPGDATQHEQRGFESTRSERRNRVRRVTFCLHAVELHCLCASAALADALSPPAVARGAGGAHEDAHRRARRAALGVPDAACAADSPFVAHRDRFANRLRARAEWLLRRVQGPAGAAGQAPIRSAC